VERRFRLTHRKDFHQVRQNGKTFPHPLVVMVVAPNSLLISRVAVITGKSIGNAVERNRVKRRIRACIQIIWPTMIAGWDLIFLARRSALTCKFSELLLTIQNMVRDAGLVLPVNTNASTE